MLFSKKESLHIGAILLSITAILLLASLLTGIYIAINVYLCFLTAALIGVLSTASAPRLQRVMRFVPIRALLAAILTFQVSETLHQKYHNSIPLSTGDFYPLALIATYLFTSRLMRIIRASHNRKLDN